MRAEEVGTVRDLKAWLDLHSVDPTDPLARGLAGGAGRRSGSDGTPLVDEYAVHEYAKLRRQADPTARAFMIDVADLEHRFPRLWVTVMAQRVPVWQARKIVAACRELSKPAAALVDAEMARVAAGLPWGRTLTLLGAAVQKADPALAERKRQQAKKARYVALCRSEDGINTMIVRADQGDLVMVYALVDRLADILQREGNTEPADERRATAFGLLAQPALVLQLLLRHAKHGTTSTTTTTAQDTTGKAEHEHHEPTPPDPPSDLFDDAGETDLPGSHQPAEPPPWTAEDYAEPPDPAPVDDPTPTNGWRRGRPGWTGPDPPTAGQPDDPDPDVPDSDTCRCCGHTPRSGVRLDLPGLAELVHDKGLKAARPRVLFYVHLTEETLRTGAGVVRVDHPDIGPMLATQLREFLVKHSCQITVRPVLDLDHVPPVDGYEIPDRVREAVRLRHIASTFPYSGHTSNRRDLDHTDPYRCDGTPGQTGVDTLGPLARAEHNARTHGRWTVTSPHPGVFLWRSPNGYHFLTTNQGTQSLGRPPNADPDSHSS